MSDALPPAPPPPPQEPRRDISVGAAISWAFDRFKRYAAAFVGLAAVVTVLQLAQQVGVRPLQNVITDCADTATAGQVNACNAALGAGFIVTLGFTLVFMLLTLFAQIGVQRAAIRSSQGVTPSFAEMFTTENLGKYVLFILVYGALTVAGLILCILPGIVVVFLLQLGRTTSSTRATEWATRSRRASRR